MERPSPELQKEVLDDNARKFITEPLNADFLSQHGAVSYVLTTDWLETDESSEKKVVCKRYDDGNIQRLLITKVTKDGTRTSEKEKITEDEYDELLEHSLIHVEKRRAEFGYEQNGIVFEVKYDEFAASDLRILEVDAATDEQRQSFDPIGGSHEVTGDMGYYGYRVAQQI